MVTGPFIRRLVVILAAALLVAGCGSSNSTAASSPKPSPSPTPTKEAQVTTVDACKLVTDAEASAAVGSTVTNLAASGGASIPGACIYTGQDSAGNQLSVFVFAQTYPDTTTADSISPDQVAAMLNGQYGVSNAKAVTGIGDKAFEYTTTSAASSGTGEAIFVFKANVVLMILISPSTDSTKVEQLARTAVGRL